MATDTLVVLQPGYLPWLGFFDQVLAQKPDLQLIQAKDSRIEYDRILCAMLQALAVGEIAE
jgi:hypothetical protein